MNYRNSKLSRLREFYENFKFSLSDEDFSDVEEVSSVETIKVEAPSPLKKVKTEEIYVLIEDISKVRQAGKQVLQDMTVKENQNLNIHDDQVLMIKSGRSNQKLSNSLLKVKSEEIFKKNSKKSPQGVVSSSSKIKFFCPRCKKGFTKQTFFDHNKTQCDRAIAFKTRQSAMKKLI